MSFHCPKCGISFQSNQVSAETPGKCPQCATVFLPTRNRSTSVPIAALAPVAAPVGEGRESRTSSGISFYVACIAVLAVLLAGMVIVLMLPVQTNQEGSVAEKRKSTGGSKENPVQAPDQEGHFGRHEFLPERVTGDDPPEVESRVFLEPKKTEEPVEEEKPKVEAIVPLLLPKTDEVNSDEPPQVMVEFLQSVAKGNRFAIIADRSGSMSNSFPAFSKLENRIVSRPAIQHLQTELIRTLQSSANGTHFYVSFYDDQADPMPVDDTWMEGRENFNKLLSWIKSITPRGGTNPMPSFERVFSLKPRPDAIFFMTDGKLSGNFVTQIAKLNNQEPKIKINTIYFTKIQGQPVKYKTPRYDLLLQAYQFPESIQTVLQHGYRSVTTVGGNESPQLKLIAQQSGGTYTQYGVRPPPAIPKLGLAANPVPVLALAGQITNGDAAYRERQTRFKRQAVSLQAGTRYQIDLLAAFDAYLYLEDSKGTVVAYDADSGDGRHALIRFTPPRSGSYCIIATTSAKSQVGSYALTVVEGGV
jgi:hypothetical protein